MHLDAKDILALQTVPSFGSSLKASESELLLTPLGWVWGDLNWHELQLIAAVYLVYICLDIAWGNWQMLVDAGRKALGWKSAWLLWIYNDEIWNDVIRFRASSFSWFSDIQHFRYLLAPYMRIPCLGAVFYSLPLPQRRWSIWCHSPRLILNFFWDKQRIALLQEPQLQVCHMRFLFEHFEPCKH